VVADEAALLKAVAEAPPPQPEQPADTNEHSHHGYE
jgi:hypothetical protein